MKPFMTIEEIISVPRLSQQALSEDGKLLAWVESKTSWDKNEYIRRVHIYDSNSKSGHELTTLDTQSHSPAWSPQNQLAFLSPCGERDEKADQVFIMADGNPFQATAAKSGTPLFKWAPDGKGLYLIAPDEKLAEKQKKRKKLYGDFTYTDRDDVWGCVYFQQLEPDSKGIIADPALAPKDLRKTRAKAKKVAGGKGIHIVSFDICPKGEELAFLATQNPSEAGFGKTSLYVQNLKNDKSEPRELPTSATLNGYGPILFSPKGDEICYTCFVDEGKWFNLTTVETQNLTTGETALPLLSLDECPNPVAWTQDGIVFTLQQKTDWYLYRLDNDRKVVPIRTQPGSVTSSAFASKNGKHLAYLTATAKTPQELYLDDELITKQSRYYNGKTLSQKEVISWSSEDGTIIEGVLITPPNGNKAEPSPLLVMVHGGPTWAAFATITTDRNYPVEQFIDRGFIILDVNYRGSSGYGAKFRKLNYRNLGLGDYDDVISGVNHLVKLGLADENRVGIMGWSQGGYISAMCATYSDRFKAISMGAGISNWYTYYANTDITPFTRHYLGDSPWNDREIYEKTSPITYIKQAKTPTLIQHGEADTRVPYANAKELHQGLKDMGVPVQLVSFKGMGHGAQKPGLHRAIMKQNYAWFCHHLLGDDMNEFWLTVD